MNEYEKKWKFLIGIAAIVLILLCCFSNNPTKNMTSAEQILTYEIEHDKTPSVQYFFFTQDSILDCFHKGFADIALQKYVDTTTTYKAFLVTKTFTARIFRNF